MSTDIPKKYVNRLNLIETEIAIKYVKDVFERALAESLNLTRVSAPLFVLPETGLNDDLNGVERPVQFDILTMKKDVQIVQSLAKWKRNALHRYQFKPQTGLYTDMNAIRRDEVLDNLHSIYVDQWDWEKVITKEERNYETLQKVVRSIWNAIRKTQQLTHEKFPVLSVYLPEEIHFISTQELEDLYPDKTPKERENEACQKYGAVFLTQIGKKLKSGNIHDGRAPDYDDWELNGDILIWYDVLGIGLELSSMGIRVDAQSLKSQLEISGKADREKLPFHQGILTNELPLTIGGGIGQSRLCMAILEKFHVGEVQASVWPHEMIEELEKSGITLL